MCRTPALQSSAADAPEQQDGESKETLLASLMDGGVGCRTALPCLDVTL